MRKFAWCIPRGDAYDCKGCGSWAVSGDHSETQYQAGDAGRCRVNNVIVIKNSVLAGLSLLGALIANALGGWDAALMLLVGMMAVDYITGLMNGSGVLEELQQERLRGLRQQGGLQGPVQEGRDSAGGLGGDSFG